MEFVLSDKTGTLTENVMVLKKCSIGGVKYDYEDGELLPSDCMDTTDGPPLNSFKPTVRLAMSDLITLNMVLVFCFLYITCSNTQG